jgi:hypothetical protein
LKNIPTFFTGCDKGKESVEVSASGKEKMGEKK